MIESISPITINSEFLEKNESSSFITTIPIDIKLISYENTISDERALRSLLITKNPEICNNKPIILGTRISVTNIVELHHILGWSVEKIREEYPFLTEEQIIAALEYYSYHPEEIENYLKEEKEVNEK